jgi:hypothetical protein
MMRHWIRAFLLPLVLLGFASSTFGCNSDPCGGCPNGQRCAQLAAAPTTGTATALGAYVCAGNACGWSSLDGGTCPTDTACRTVSWDPCGPSCNISEVSGQFCVRGVAAETQPADGGEDSANDASVID